MTEREKPVWNIGITLVVLIFMNLCLVVFAVLSLENAVSDRNLTRKTAEHTKAYYQAYSNVEERWAQAENILRECRGSSSDEKAYNLSAVSKLQEAGFAVEKENTECHIIWKEDVAKGQILCGKARIIWDKGQENVLKIESMIVEQSGPWNAEQTLDVFKGKE